MSNLADAQLHMKGEEQSPVFPEAAPTLGAVQVEKKQEFVVFKIANSNKDGGVRMVAIDYVIDPRTITDEKPDGNGPEMIRLLEGVTTIWAKEQKDIPEQRIRKITRTIEFPRGTRFISVPNWDAQKVAWMRLCRHNIKSPNRTMGSKIEFFEYDPNEIAKEKFKREELELEMTIKAHQQPLEKMTKHAFYLGINLVDELGRAKLEKTLRTEYMISAKRDPETFKKSLDSREVDIQFKVRSAILDAKIDFSKGDGKAYWAIGGELICALPSNEAPYKFLTNLALTPNTEGKNFLEKLNLLSP